MKQLILTWKSLCHEMACFERKINIQIYSRDSNLKHYILWGSHSGHYFVCSMTHYDIKMGNDISGDIHCDIIMGHDIVMDTYRDVTVHTDVARTLIYYVLLSPIKIFLCFFVKSLKLYITR